MPGRDGTGPLGQGPMNGRGAGWSRRRGAVGAGPAGYCFCPKCGEKTVHTSGVPCTSFRCPRCGAMMTRDF